MYYDDEVSHYARDGSCNRGCKRPATRGKYCLDHWLERKVKAVLYKNVGMYLCLPYEELLEEYKDVLDKNPRHICALCGNSTKVHTGVGRTNSLCFTRKHIIDGFIKGNIIITCRTCNNRLGHIYLSSLDDIKRRGADKKKRKKRGAGGLQQF